MEPLDAFLSAHAEDGLLPWSMQVEAASRFEMSLKEVEERALLLDLLPLRYCRNQQALSTAQQLRLLRGKVAVVGCGGLGGTVIEELSRLGVGTIAAIDPDRFQEHNLNRQLLSSMAALGRSKVEVAHARVREINPAVDSVPVMRAITQSNGAQLLNGYDVVVDALDSIQTRLELARICHRLDAPLVHGSVGGWYGQVTVQLPGDDILEKIYGASPEDQGVEKELGNPCFAPAVVASIQAAEVCKLLTGVGKPLTDRMLCIDLLAMKVVEARS